MSPSVFNGTTLLDPGQGFEPWLVGPEPTVLPLDDPGARPVPSSGLDAKHLSVRRSRNALTLLVLKRPYLTKKLTHSQIH